MAGNQMNQFDAASIIDMKATRMIAENELFCTFPKVLVVRRRGRIWYQRSCCCRGCCGERLRVDCHGDNVQQIHLV